MDINVFKHVHTGEHADDNRRPRAQECHLNVGLLIIYFNQFFELEGVLKIRIACTSWNLLLIFLNPHRVNIICTK